MKFLNRFKIIGLLSSICLLALISCNKLELEPTATPPSTPRSGVTLAAMLDDPSFSLLKTVVERVGLKATLGDTSLRFTVFAPNNAAIIASLSSFGVTNEATAAGVLASLPEALALGIISYHVIPQEIRAASIPETFPNFGYPTILNPSIGTPRFNPLVRLSNYPSRRGSTVWVNNIPVVAADMTASNGILHVVPRIVFPPSKALWDRIDTDTSLTFLKAAILRADSGTTAVPGTLNQSVLQSVLSNFGPELTVFAPTNNAFRQALYAQTFPLIYQRIYGLTYQAAIAGGLPETVATTMATDSARANAGPTTTSLTSTPGFFQNPLFFGALPSQSVKGIVVYHVLGKRAFSVNLSNTTAAVPTLLNGVFATHPGLQITATFAGPSVTAITVKGVANSAASNVLINPTPDLPIAAPTGTSDQVYTNGNLHKIDRLLLPQ